MGAIMLNKLCYFCSRTSTRSMPWYGHQKQIPEWEITKQLDREEAHIVKKMSGRSCFRYEIEG